MVEALELARSVLAGCAAGVGPLIGLDLEVEEPTLVEAAPTDGPSAVLAVSVLEGDTESARVELLSPLEQLAPLALRTLGESDPETKDELTDEQLGAIAETLGLMGGAIAESLRGVVGDEARIQAGDWWRSDEPGSNALAEDERVVVRVGLVVPGGQATSLFLRIPAELVSGSAAPDAPHTPRRVLLLDVDEATGQRLAAPLESLALAPEPQCSDDPELADAWLTTALIILAGEPPQMLALCRRLRTDNASWDLPILVCVPEATKELVVQALEAGASHVLALGPDVQDREIQRVIALARERTS